MATPYPCQITMDNLQTKFAHYHLQKKLGQGGMGEVYQAIDKKLNRTVAIKIIRDHSQNNKEIKRFLQEAQVMAKLNHPNIIKIYEIGTFPMPFIVMEFIDGEHLGNLIKQKSISTSVLVKFIYDVAQALVVVHKANIIHRDIKPSNIMITNNVAKLMDFGLAKVEKDHSSLSKSGDIIGTPAYMAPEQVEGDARPSSDIYSLGATMYQGLTGRPPFEGDNYINILSQLIFEYPIPPRDLNPDISASLEAICLKCLEKKPSKRYFSAKQLSRELNNFMENRPILAKPYTRIERLKKFIAHNRILSAATAAFFFITIILVTMLAKSYVDLKQKVIQRDQALQIVNERELELNEKIKKINQQFQKIRIQKLQIENASHQAVYQILDLFKRFVPKYPGILTDTSHLVQYVENLAFSFPENFLPRDKKTIKKFIKAYFTAMYNKKGAFKQYAAIEKEYPFILLFVTRQMLYRKDRNYAKALEDCQKILALDKSNTNAHVLMAEIFNSQGLHAKALKKTDYVLDINKDHPGVHQLRGHIYLKLRQAKKAIASFTAIIEKEFSDEKVYYNRGMAYNEMKKYDKALEDFNKAIELDKYFAPAYFQRARVHNVLDNKDKAITDYKKVLQLAPKKVAQCHDELGDIYFGQGNRAKAIEEWQKAIKADRNMATRIQEKIDKAQNK